ncbi:MAG: ABC transporter ATP-binding protein [Pseudonocardia sp.]|uniref:ABC transporter ATP-binding protein n=1 Tax=unclassified Pseudonocardia TaxID=2619320 RepID=UPI00086D5F27|nr:MULTISPECIES: ABC transporter ATP-binding protein [unclassified Pseudonocardia]MBN9107583.1 ABC transporter ATP-binding protein [Pseudonocardia sp.]ODU22988.1 MAG: ABC transporter ATP-binding protein [Pseudonocardia sp. SCN 72-51]ODV08434.1 MAG: ABC transporter ATP-binding protein [Pseudonocardia sp. SCN 73-27]
MLLEIDDARTGYGGLEVLHGVSLTVDEGEIVTVLGPNGTGKTSLMRLLSGVLPLWSGRITFDGKDLGKLPPNKRAGLGLCQLPEGRGIFQTLTVGENLDLGLAARRAHGNAAKADRDRVLDLFPELAGRLDQSASSLSGGQQQMLALGRALMSQPRLLLIDELSFGLAPRVVRDLFDVVRELREQGVTLLIVEQQAAALRVSDRTYILRGGRNELTRDSDELLASDELVSSYLR